jgi:hypothetical protein
MSLETARGLALGAVVIGGADGIWRKPLMAKLEVSEITFYPDPKGTVAAAQAMAELHRRATVPVLLAKDMPVGPTGYLDRLQPRGMSAPIMVGVDQDRRPFIAFRVILEDAGHYSAPRVGVVTAFQRYPSSGRIWTTGGDLSNHEVFGTGDTPSVACFRDLLDRGRHEAKLKEYELGEPTGRMRTVVVRLDGELRSSELRPGAR